MDSQPSVLRIFLHAITATLLRLFFRHIFCSLSASKTSDWLLQEHQLSASSDSHFSRASSRGALLPFGILVMSGLPKISYATIEMHTPVRATLRKLFQKDSLMTILGAHFLLQLFYLWMIIYVPLYLHAYIGFGWNTIGLLLS